VKGMAIGVGGGPGKERDPGGPGEGVEVPNGARADLYGGIGAELGRLLRGYRAACRQGPALGREGEAREAVEGAGAGEEGERGVEAGEDDNLGLGGGEAFPCRMETQREQQSYRRLDARADGAVNGKRPHQLCQGRPAAAGVEARRPRRVAVGHAEAPRLTQQRAARAPPRYRRAAAGALRRPRSGARRLVDAGGELGLPEDLRVGVAAWGEDERLVGVSVPQPGA
jgi:hypothetical protein